MNEISVGVVVLVTDTKGEYTTRVTGQTKTLWKVTGRRFNKSTLLEVGGWGNASIRVATEKDIARCAEATRRKSLLGMLGRVQWNRLETFELERVVKTLGDERIKQAIK